MPFPCIRNINMRSDKEDDDDDEAYRTIPDSPDIAVSYSPRSTGSCFHNNIRDGKALGTRSRASWSVCRQAKKDSAGDRSAVPSLRLV
jgi:hypothetical protein